MKSSLLSLAFVVLACTKPTLRVANPEILASNSDPLIINNGNLSFEYDDSTFNQVLSCRNGNLNIIDVAKGPQITVSYEGMPVLSKSNMVVTASPNNEPKPFVSKVNQTHFEVTFNCSCGNKGKTCDSYNYFNKVRVQMFSGYAFSFLINCDASNRHKQFQFGYLFMALINSTIIIGVAMHSHVWSIRIKQRPLRYVLKWKAFLIFSGVGVGLIFSLTFLTYRDFWVGFGFIKYFGIVFSFFFLFLCLNQCLYLIKGLRKPVLKMMRQCDILSGILSIAIMIMAFFYDNWILYNILAGCICVGSIKIFHFNSLKESYLSMAIMVATVSVLCIILHFLLPFSYNDYAGELSSPLFFGVPDLVNNLFKKCSWLPVLDVIIPGVTLSYLRLYDENRSSKWGGLYTLSGNLTFVISTVIWIGIEIVDPFSCPFSVVTCPLLMLVIFIISWRRNQWYTLLHGRFEQGYDVLDMDTLRQTRDSFSKLIPESVISETLIYREVASSVLSN